MNLFLVSVRLARCRPVSTSIGYFRCFASQSKSPPDSLASVRGVPNSYPQAFAIAFHSQKLRGLTSSPNWSFSSSYLPSAEVIV